MVQVICELYLSFILQYLCRNRYHISTIYFILDHIYLFNKFNFTSYFHTRYLHELYDTLPPSKHSSCEVNCPKKQSNRTPDNKLITAENIRNDEEYYSLMEYLLELRVLSQIKYMFIQILCICNIVNRWHVSRIC